MYLSDHINTNLKHCHASVISENVLNLLIFREYFLDLRLKSVCAVKMTMYVHWTCMNINRKNMPELFNLMKKICAQFCKI